jgi:hypothetical protein
MKMVMIYADTFEYVPREKTLEEFETIEHGETFNQILVGFIQVEETDEEDINGVEKKLVKNLKWAAGKNNTKRILLHSFAHLSESKADARFTKEIFNLAEIRLKNAGYEVFQTPFGYFLDLNFRAPGVSQARIFKSF